jgi:hypothetical protein
VTSFRDDGVRSPDDITAGHDGALWYSGIFFPTQAIGRISASGVATVHTSPAFGSQLSGFTAGPRGAMWLSTISEIGTGWIGWAWTTTTAITSVQHLPAAGQPIRVHVQVTAAPGAPTPRGQVALTLVRAAGGCKARLSGSGRTATGSCVIRVTSARRYTVTASYRGDSVLISSQGQRTRVRIG